MRALVILWRLGPLVVSFLRDQRRWVVRGGPVVRRRGFHERRAARLVHAIAKLGPSFVKMAQVFATRADLLPAPYVTALSTLTDQVPPVPTDVVRSEIERAYGRPVEGIFERFDDLPVAAASLGQVHRACWNGEEVAVKVLRPGVEDLVRQDMAVALPLARWLERRFPNPHLRNGRTVIEEFSVRIWEEMDFVREAANATEIRANFQGNPRVLVPRVIAPLVRRHVLVLEYVEGVRVDRLTPHPGEKSTDPRGVVSTVMELYLQMMLVDGLFHADPHPGNILVAPDGRIVLLDFGMVIRVPREMRWHLVQTVYAAIKRDVDGILAGFVALGVIDPTANLVAVRELAVTLLAIADNDRSMRERIELLADQVMSTLYDWPVRLPSELVYFARTAALIEGLGVRYDPYFNPINFAGPIALRMRGKILGSLAEGGVPASVDLPSLFGSTLGAVARGVVSAGRNFVDAVADELTAPEGFSFGRLFDRLANGLTPVARQAVGEVMDASTRHLRPSTVPKALPATTGAPASNGAAPPNGKLESAPKLLAGD